MGVNQLQQMGQEEIKVKTIYEKDLIVLKNPALVPQNLEPLVSGFWSENLLGSQFFSEIVKRNVQEMEKYNVDKKVIKQINQEMETIEVSENSTKNKKNNQNYLEQLN